MIGSVTLQQESVTTYKRLMLTTNHHLIIKAKSILLSKQSFFGTYFCQGQCSVQNQWTKFYFYNVCVNTKTLGKNEHLTEEMLTEQGNWMKLTRGNRSFKFADAWWKIYSSSSEGKVGLFEQMSFAWSSTIFLSGLHSPRLQEKKNQIAISYGQEWKRTSLY